MEDLESRIQTLVQWMAEARRLVLYHHDPAHDDAWVDRARDLAAGKAGPDIEVLAAAEGLTLHSGR